MRDTHAGGISLTDPVPGHIAEIVSDLGPMDPGSRSVFYYRRRVE
jgi:hypothetical protein